MASQDDGLQRSALPIPDMAYSGTITYDATSPDTKFPPITPLRPPAGAHQVKAEFAYDGGGVGKGGVVTLLVDDQKVGEGRVEVTMPYQYSFDETLDVGVEVGSPVSAEYGPSDNAFTGAVTWVRLDIGADSHDHLIDPAHLLHIAMVRQ